MIYLRHLSRSFCSKYSKIRQPNTHRRCFASLNLVALPVEERESLLRQMALPLSRQDPIVTKLNSTQFYSIFTDEVRTLQKLFEKYGYELRVAGGAVRDLLMGIKPKDLDFATTASPEQMKEMFNTESVRMINLNGERHGTITPRINDKENFEVTTLRIDVVCDGRHAEIQFTKDWMLDALRRDLTINSMFLGFDGSVYDYFFGYDDLKARKVQFVGDANVRIQEDYLRILRYFRFYGRIAQEPNAHVPGILKTIQDNGKGLANVSGERIWMELQKILEGRFAADILQNIVECQLSPYIGLSQSVSVYGLAELKTMWQRSAALKPRGITILSALVSSINEAEKLHERLKFSAFDRDMLYFLVENRSLLPPAVGPLQPYQRMVVKNNSRPKDTYHYVEELLKYLGNADLLSKFRLWEIPTFPVNGRMVKEHSNVESGRFLGIVLNELKYYWADNDFQPDVQDILQQLPRILNDLKSKRERKRSPI